MHRGEDQVSGKRRVDRDLRGFLVADFAHHDLVGIVAQDGPQAAREGQPLLFVHRNLRDALDLILHRIFDGDDFVFVVLDFAQGGIERGGLARTRGSGHQHHAVGLFDIAPELDQVGIAETDYVERKLRELLAHGLFIEHTEHGVLAVDGRHDRHAEIDQAVLVAHAEAAVLGHAALGDIQFRHHLDARNDGGVPVLGNGRHRVMQNAVDAVFDGYFLIAGLDVNIAGAPFERVENGGIDQLDYRRDIRIGRGQAIDGERLVAVFFFAHYIERKALGHFFEHALRLLGLLEQVGDLRERSHPDTQLLPQQDREFVNQVEIPRIRQRDFE